jgi:hypothetical protein
MAKNLLILPFLVFMAFSCPNLDNEKDTNVLSVAENEEGTHTATGLKITIKKYDLTKAADLLSGLIDVDKIKDFGKEIDLDKVMLYTATLPNGETTKGYLIVSELPKDILNFQKVDEYYVLRAISIDDNLAGTEVKFKILPQEKPAEIIEVPSTPTLEPYVFTTTISDNETFTDSRTDAYFFVRSHDLTQQTITGDLALPNTERKENITIKPLELFGFEHDGIKYQFAVRKIEELNCEIFVREIR